MTNEKTAFQKMVEKVIMLERNDRFSIILADGPKGLRLCVGLVSESGITPLAELMSQRDIDALEPDFDTFQKLGDCLTEARKILRGSKPTDFEANPQLDVLNEDAVTRISRI